MKELQQDEKYGKIALKSYTRKLLDNFLKAKPNKEWVK